jgi:hypothetical protein
MFSIEYFLQMSGNVQTKYERRKEEKRTGDFSRPMAVGGLQSREVTNASS